MSGSPPDGNKTVFRPSPLQGLKSAAAKPAPAVQTQAQAPAQTRPSPLAAAHLQGAAPPATDRLQPAVEASRLRNAMLAAASPMLALAAGLRAGRVRLPLAQFHREATQAIAAFDRAIRAAYPDDVRQRALYVLCVTLDDIAQNLPGLGGDGAEWARRSLVVQAFRAPIGGERFWQIVDGAVRAPAGQRDLLELCNACLAAGFEDRYRAAADGKRQLHEVMTRIQSVLAQYGEASPTQLSPHWRGEQAPVGKVGAGAPVAVAAAAAAAILLAAYVALRLLLLQSGATPAAAVAAITPEAPLRLSRGGASVAPPAASRTAALLKAALAGEIARGEVAVEEDAATVRVRTTAGPLFAPGSDRLAPRGAALLARIGAAVQAQPGPVTLEDHVAGDGSASLAFPDALALSTARADRAAAALRRQLTAPARVTAKGMGGTVPLAPNGGAEGRATNDRVEVVLPRSS